MNNMKIVVVGGGSGGHIYPGLAVAEKLIEDNDVHFVLGAKEIDKNIAKNFDQKIKVKHINALSFNKKYSFKKVKTWPKFFNFIFRLKMNTFSQLIFLKKNKIERIFATGGYVCVPVMIAGKLLRKKMFFHEQNVVLGLAGKVAKRLGVKILYSWPTENANVEVVGCPLKKEIQALVDESDASLTTNQVVIFGGSNGSKEINDYIAQNLNEISKKTEMNLINITGANEYSSIKPNAKKGYEVIEYSHDLPELIAKAKFVVCRSGATTCFELMALKKPALLLPLKSAGNNEQVKNAQAMEKMGYGVKVNGETFLTQFLNFSNNEDSILDNIQVSYSQHKFTNAVDEIVEIIQKG